eukprot:gnl/Trimastix_PCT/4281.p1 GENE.gnl/Trimastix_PCT/4281~~gnl/Trimastix_PCT/4281.p1  ORF type:complete len:195 (-),score=13.64 gnl/Trimastix_PCT/4281:69-653(-)
MSSLEAKVVLLGTSGVGKTSILVRFMHNTFSDHFNSTIGASFQIKRLHVEGVDVQLQIWDTAGQERFRALAPMYYHQAQAAIIVYDVTSVDSFRKAKEWIDELKSQLDDDVVLFLAGNKCDLGTKAFQVSQETAQQYAHHVGAEFSHVSAKNGQGLEDVFLGIAQRLLRKKKRPRRTAAVALDTGLPPEKGCAC